MWLLIKATCRLSQWNSRYAYMYLLLTVNQFQFTGGNKYNVWPCVLIDFSNASLLIISKRNTYEMWYILRTNIVIKLIKNYFDYVSVNLKLQVQATLDFFSNLNYRLQIDICDLDVDIYKQINHFNCSKICVLGKSKKVIEIVIKTCTCKKKYLKLYTFKIFFCKIRFFLLRFGSAVSYHRSINRMGSSEWKYKFKLTAYVTS